MWRTFLFFDTFPFDFTSYSRDLFQDTDITGNHHVSLVEYCITKYKSLLKNADGTSFDVESMVSHLMETKEVISPELEKAQKVRKRNFHNLCFRCGCDNVERLDVAQGMATIEGGSGEEVGQEEVADNLRGRGRGRGRGGRGRGRGEGISFQMRVFHLLTISRQSETPRSFTLEICRTIPVGKI